MMSSRAWINGFTNRVKRLRNTKEVLRLIASMETALTAKQKSIKGLNGTIAASPKNQGKRLSIVLHGQTSQAAAKSGPPKSRKVLVTVPKMQDLIDQSSLIDGVERIRTQTSVVRAFISGSSGIKASSLAKIEIALQALATRADAARAELLECLDSIASTSLPKGLQNYGVTAERAVLSQVPANQYKDIKKSVFLAQGRDGCFVRYVYYIQPLELNDAIGYKYDNYYIIVLLRVSENGESEASLQSTKEFKGPVELKPGVVFETDTDLRAQVGQLLKTDGIVA